MNNLLGGATMNRTDESLKAFVGIQRTSETLDGGGVNLKTFKQIQE